MTKCILVTGGSGYIGSHTVLALLQAKFKVVVIDNLSNSSSSSLGRVSEICGKSPAFLKGDVRDPGFLRKIFSDYDVHSVIHFAGLKSVGESSKFPLMYFDNNVSGTLNLCMVMEEFGVRNLVFSSSATVYGETNSFPIREDFPVGEPTNPYGRSKLMVEEALRDVSSSNKNWKIAILRYFNPAGAHSSGLIGEDPMGVPNNLIPYISQVAVGKLSKLSIFGNDYPTVDGTGVRDYIHVQDLAAGHLKALSAIEEGEGLRIWNLGTGRGYSVLEAIRAFEVASGKHIPFQVMPRRPGDIAECWADPAKAFKDLGWKAELGLSDMMADAWRWQQRNPDGFGVRSVG